jgi:RimJ/RimL family protein N-acetyltransferase
MAYDFQLPAAASPPESLIAWQPRQRPGPVTLRGRRVTLEPFEAATHGEDLWQAICGHDELWKYMANGPYATEAGMVEGLERWRQVEQAVLLAIVPVESARAAGWASYMRIEPAHGVIEVGNIMFSPSLKRTPEATEAMYLMASHVFDHLGYRRYEWKCNAANLASRRAAERLGFTFEGIFRQHMVAKGQNRDSAWYSMLDREWPARKRALETWLDLANFDETGRQRQPLNLPEVPRDTGR